MKTRYFNKQDLETYFESRKLQADITDKTFIGISSIAEIIELCDQYKRKGNHEFLSDLDEFSKNPMADGMVYVSELDQYTLSSNLFENEDIKTDLWVDGTDRNTNPIHSVRCLTLRPNDYVFWGNDVYSEMREYFD